MRAFNMVTTVRREITDAEYDLIYSSAENKGQLIRFMRGQYNLGLKEAKDLCDAIWDSPHMAPGETR